MNYFQQFDLPEQLELNLTTLKANFLKLQQQYHPDQAKDKNLALIQSSEINQAYKTLFYVDSRAGYLLKLQQQDQNLDQSIHDLDFLQSALELREMLDEAASVEQLNQLKKEVGSHVDSLTNAFNTQFSQQQWLDAQDSVRKLQFFQKVLNDIDKAEEDILDHQINLDDDF
ncbi:Fe-S protein assembly co-chaperone HscB [Acinetobacter rathckeae]|uniref:Fe-S protein assembly co-chaperone HscB n=1 Tax=Acinetobacter rathckeae TaxID=2605272 RepID=UPI0018A32812|nr:Fe-S protein assembly co-chaperone HscB [Acinetobacter rathckeae]MBF7687186.1 Fe-S protein assembly co-chaperone HscB [Acinetobacter rathckeae]MBF7694461.1 Fe-S protein assembly co-chaperone HscB [Acinetobacter rathckeae]